MRCLSDLRGLRSLGFRNNVINRNRVLSLYSKSLALCPHNARHDHMMAASDLDISTLRRGLGRLNKSSARRHIEQANVAPRSTCLHACFDQHLSAGLSHLQIVQPSITNEQSPAQSILADYGWLSFQPLNLISILALWHWVPSEMGRKRTQSKEAVHKQSAMA